MSNTAVLNNKIYVEKNAERKSLLTKIVNYFKENQDIIIAGLLSMNGRIDSNVWSAVDENKN